MDVSKNRGTQNGWFTMENPIKIHDLVVPLFLETPILSEQKQHVVSNFYFHGPSNYPYLRFASAKK